MSAEPDYTKKWFYFGVSAIAVFMATLDSSIVNVALPTLGSEFGADVKVVAWVVQAYLLTSTALLLIGGRLLDVLGEKKVFTAGFALFTAGSVLCALSNSIEMLIASRVFQGIGSATLMSSNMGLVARAFPPHQRGRALGMSGTVVSVGLASGPPIGGLLIGWLGWRSIFYVNIPIGVAAILYCLRVFSDRVESTKSVRFDWTGALLLVAGLTSLFIGLDLGEAEGWSDSKVLVLLAVSPLLLSLFLLNEHKTPSPILKLALFKSRYFSQSCAAAFLAFFAIAPVIILTPFYLQNVRGLDPEKVGLAMMAMPAAMILVAPLGGWISDLIGTRIPATAGLVLVGGGLLFLARLDAQSGTWEAVRGLGLVGVGMGLFASPNSNGLLSSVPRENVGTASGLAALMRTSGIAFGLSVAATVFTSFRNEAEKEALGLGLDEMAMEQRLYLSGICPVFFLAACIVAVNLINSATRGRGDTIRNHP